MRIAFIGQKGIPATYGGVERHVEELAARLAQAGHEVLAYTRPNYTSPNIKEYKGVKLISLPSVPTKHLDAISHTFLSIIDLAVKRDVDIIHFHSIGPSSLIWLAKLLKPRTLIVSTFHTRCYLHQKWGVAARTYLKFSEYIACKLPHKTIAVSLSLAEYAKTKYNVETVYIPNGVNIPSAYSADKIRQWGLENGSYILAVSRLVAHKGLGYLAEAYKKIKTDKKLVIAGGSSYTDKYVAELKNLAGNNPNIIFTGNQTGEILAELFSNAYLFVQPSESEGLSLALLEAMSYGLPILVSDIAENKEAIGETGFIFKSKDVNDLIDKLNFMLNHQELIRSRGVVAKQRAGEIYDWEKITGQTIKLYQNLLSQ